jgi:hypothetical protein
MVFQSPEVEERLDSITVCCNFGRGKVLVCIWFREVVPKDEFDVLVTFNDGRS